MASARAQSGTVAFAEAVCGLCLLCSGSKSSKLSFTYALFDEVGLRRRSAVQYCYFTWLAWALSVSMGTVQFSIVASHDQLERCAIQYWYFTWLAERCGGGVAGWDGATPLRRVAGRRW
jgi:hypothetical protein